MKVVGACDEKIRGSIGAFASTTRDAERFTLCRHPPLFIDDATDNEDYVAQATLVGYNPRGWRRTACRCWSSVIDIAVLSIKK